MALTPEAGLTVDKAGKLYGTTKKGGVYGFGTVFRLSYKNSAWMFETLYSFKGGMMALGLRQEWCSARMECSMAPLRAQKAF